MRVACRECGWQGTPEPGQEHCPACRTPFAPGTGLPDLRDPSPEPPRAPAGAASPVHRAGGAAHLRPRRTGSFLLGLGIAGLAAAGAVLAYAPTLVTSAPAASKADEAPTAAAPAPASTPPPASPAPGPPDAAPPGEIPPVAVVARELPAHLPAGYAAAGAPTLAGPPSPDGRYEYRVPLQAQRSLHRVPVVPVRLASGVPAALRENRAMLVFHDALPPGREYDLDAARPASRQGDRVDGTWRVRLARQDGAWRVMDASPVAVVPPAGDGASELLTEDALARARTERREALDRYTARLRTVERDLEAFRAGLLRDVPPRCAADVSSLLGEVVRLATDCPAVADAGQRSACFARRDQANQEMGACQRKNQLHEERSEAARRAVAVRQGERLAAFARELAREASAHQQRVGG